MTTDRELERVLDRWFTDGPTRMPEAFLDDTLDRIDRSRRPGLAGLGRDARPMGARAWFGVAAAVVLAVAGISAGLVLRHDDRKNASVGYGDVPVALQAEWRPVGPRQHPTAVMGDTVPLDLDIVIDASTITILDYKYDVVSAASLVGPDRLDLRILTSPGEAVPGQPTPALNPNWGCRVGDAASYIFQLSPSGLDLTLTPVSDACAARATILAGDWSRTDNGALAPGRHEATLFKPFDSGTAGRFAFTVPPGWAVVGEHVSGETSIALGTPSGASRVIVLANALPTTPQLDCGRASDVIVDATASGYGRWLAGRHGLVLTAPTPVTVGGLAGIMVDAAVDPVEASACEGRVENFYKASLPLYLEGEGRARYYLLDASPGVVLLVAVEAQDLAAWDAAIADATPVIESFEFAR